MGVRKTTDFLEKSTWALVAALVVLCLFATVMNKPGEQKLQQSVSQEKAESATETAPAAKPDPAPAPLPDPIIPVEDPVTPPKFDRMTVILISSSTGVGTLLLGILVWWCTCKKSAV